MSTSASADASNTGRPISEMRGTKADPKIIPKIRDYLKDGYEKIVRMEAQKMVFMSNPDLSALQKVQRVCQYVAEENEIEPISLDDHELWKTVEPVADLMVDLFMHPDSFDPREYADIVRKVEPGEEEQERGEPCQTFYLRFRAQERATAVQDLITYMQREPVDAAWALARLASHGESGLATEELAKLLSICGYAGAEFKVEDTPSLRLGDKVGEQYRGTTTRNVKIRHGEDLARDAACRLSHYLKNSSRSPWDLYEITIWTFLISHSLAFRTHPLLSKIEFIWVATGRQLLTSADGGNGIHYRPPQAIKNICLQTLQELPPPAAGEEDGVLSSWLEALIDEEVEFFQQLRDAGHNVGEPASPEIIAAIKRDFGHIRIVNGRAVVLNILKDVTLECFFGLVPAGVFSDGMGRAMFHRWDQMRFILSLDGMDVDDDIRYWMGAYLDLWRLIIIHRWWRLMVILLGILLRAMRPLLVVGFSAPVAHLFLEDNIQLAMEQVKLQDQLEESLVEEPTIASGQAPPKFPAFLDHIGQLRIIADDGHFFAFIANLHSGRIYYQPRLQLLRLRVSFFIAFKAYVAQRVIEVGLSSLETPLSDGDEELELLEGALDKTAKMLKRFKVEDRLANALEELRNAEAADVALRSKTVVNGVLVRTTRGRWTLRDERKVGVVASGDRYSDERHEQLERIRKIAANVDRVKGKQPVLGPRNSHPSTLEFALWFLSRNGGTSLLYSANRFGRTVLGFKAAQARDQQIAEWNKKHALKQRQDLAEKYGSYRRGIILLRFYQTATKLLQGDVVQFSEAPRVATCVSCGDIDIGMGKNTRHQCDIEEGGKESTFLIVMGAIGQQETTKFKNYLRPLYLHDLIEYERMGDYVFDEDLGEMGIDCSLAINFLVDIDGNPLKGLPRGLDPGVLTDEVIYHTEKTKASVLFAMALDMALRKHARLHETPDLPLKTRTQDRYFAQNGIKTSLPNAVRHNANKVYVTYHKNCDVVMIASSNSEARHRRAHTCTKGIGIVNAEFEEWTVDSFLSLPYVLTRAIAYRAVLGNDKELKKLMTTW